jgi:site-specific recombinase XerD
MFGETPLARSVGVRNGLLIALLALHPIRIKNFASLRIEGTFVNIEGRWWLRIPADDTKSNLVDQRQVPEFMTDIVDSYVSTHHKVLSRGNAEQRSLWISSTTGRQMTVKNLGTLISKLTRETIGVDVSPHLFRTAAVSTAAVYGGKYPHLGSALMGHRDSRVTENYNHAIGFETGDAYAAITDLYRSRPKPCE